MKNLKLLAVAAIALFTMNSFGQAKKIDVKQSKIEWVGKKVLGQHNGTVNFKNGTLTFVKNKLTGGNFIVDMTSINTTDLDASSGKEKLDGHLKADDFFGVEKHKTAILKFTKVKMTSEGVYNVAATLTIKGKTNPVSFDLTVSDNSATTTFMVDRTKYNIKYNSKTFFASIGDKAISDEFELKVNLAW